MVLAPCHFLLISIHPPRHGSRKLLIAHLARGHADAVADTDADADAISCDPHLHVL